MRLPAEGWAGAFLEATAKCKAVVIGPGLGHRRRGRGGDPGRHRRRAGPARDRRRRPDRARGRCRGAHARSTSGAPRASSRPTTASTPGSPGRPRARTGSPRRAGLAEATGAVVLLKGPLTAVAAPGRRGAPDVLLGGAGGPALATAGSGDVLSGIIGAFCARGLPPLDAAALAAHVHGRAAAARAARGPRRRRPAATWWPRLLSALRRARCGTGRPGVADGAPMRLAPPMPRRTMTRVTMAQGRSRPAWAEIDLAAVAHNAACWPAGRAGRAVRGGQGPRLRARRAGGGPGRAGRGRAAARRRARRRGSGAARARRHGPRPAAQRVRRRRRRHGAGLRAHADAVLRRGHRGLRRGGPDRRPARRRST